MEKQKYNINDVIRLIDCSGCSWWGEIIDETENYYILKCHTSNPEGEFNTGLYTRVKDGIEGLVVFKKEGFNAEKLSNEYITKHTKKKF